MEDAAAELDRIAERIAALCEAGQKSGRPYYISALGQELGSDLAILKALTKGSLTDFVLSRLSDRFELARLGQHGNVWAIIPIGGEAPSTVSDDSPPIDSQGRPKFHYRVWAAFSVPAGNDVRYLNMDDFTFADQPADVGLPENNLAIPIELIPPDNAPRRDDVIYDNLMKWLVENKLPQERFYASARKTSKPSRPMAYSGSMSVLEAVLNNLDRRQLQATHLSLDVIASLLQARRS